MADYDPKVFFRLNLLNKLFQLFQGNLKPRKRTVENSTRFSNTVGEKCVNIILYIFILFSKGS